MTRLTRIPGVGRKTAERMTLELRDRLPKVDAAAPAPAAGRRRPARRRGLGARQSRLPAGRRRQGARRRRQGRAGRRHLRRSPAPRPAAPGAMTRPRRNAAAAGRRRARRRRAPVRRRAAPAHDGRVHRAGSHPREPAGVDPGGAATRRGARSRAALRAAWPRQDHAGARHRQRAGRAGAQHRRPGAREARRSRRDPDQPQGARGAVHRRDPRHVAGDRGDPLPGARGLRARPRDRPGPGRALGEGAAAAVHAGRRDHPDRPAHRAAAQPLRHRPSARLLRPVRHGRNRTPIGPDPRRPARGAGGDRAVAPGPRHAAHRQPAACAASATTPRCAPTAPSR